MAQAKLCDFKAAGKDQWDAVVAEMEKVRDVFSHSFQYFKLQLLKVVLHEKNTHGLDFPRPTRQHRC